MNQHYASCAQDVQCLDCCRAGEKNLNATRSFLDFRSQAAVGFLAENITARSERVQNQSRFQSRQEFGTTWRAVGERAPIARLDEAFDCLDQAVAYRDPALVHLAVAPEWDSMRDDPRFAERLRSIPSLGRPMTTSVTCSRQGVLPTSDLVVRRHLAVSLARLEARMDSLSPFLYGSFLPYNMQVCS